MSLAEPEIISFPFSELAPQLAAHPFFLKEAEEIRPDIRERLARKTAEPDDLIRELFDYVEHFREALYDTFLTLDGEDLFPQELEENSDNYYDRYQVYGLGGVYWVVEKEPDSLDEKIAQKWSPDLYITFDDAASIARQRIQASCRRYLEENPHYQEPSTWQVPLLGTYKSGHDRHIRPLSPKMKHYRKARDVFVERRPHDIRLAYTHHARHATEHLESAIERLVKLQYVLATSPAWKKYKFLIEISSFQLPEDPRHLSQALVRDICKRLYGIPAIAVRSELIENEQRRNNDRDWWYYDDMWDDDEDEDRPAIDISEFRATPYGSELLLKVTDDRYLTALKIFLLKTLFLASDGVGVRLYYEAWTSRGVLAHLEEETERVALFDANLDEDPDFAKIVESEKRAHWYPSLFLAREKPLPQKGSRNYGLYLKRLMHAAQEAAERFPDGDLTFRFHFGSERYFIHSTVRMYLGKKPPNPHKWIDDFFRDNELSGFAGPVVIEVDAGYDSDEISLTLNPDELRYELTGRPFDKPIHHFMNCAAQTLSGKKPGSVTTARSDYAEPVEREEDPREPNRAIAYPTVHLGRKPDASFVREIAFEVWRLLDNDASLPVDEAVERVLTKAEAVKRFTYYNRRLVSEAVIRTLASDFTDHNAMPFENVLGGLPHSRRGTLTRALGFIGSADCKR